MSQTIVSPNNWLVRAGARIVNGHFVLPQRFLLVPLAVASEAVVAFKADNDIRNRLSQAFVIALTVRSADTAYFRWLAGVLNNANQNGIQVCQFCLRGQVFGDQMKRLRKEVNQQIIHKMEDPEAAPDDDSLGLSIDYYDEMLRLPLTLPIEIPTCEGLSFCEQCLKKHRAG